MPAQHPLEGTRGTRMRLPILILGFRPAHGLVGRSVLIPNSLAAVIDGSGPAFESLVCIFFHRVQQRLRIPSRSHLIRLLHR